jgi:hypothetical protein
MIKTLIECVSILLGPERDLHLGDDSHALGDEPEGD